nr:hypothetical protein [Tanacetum cinerariifolium]
MGSGLLPENAPPLGSFVVGAQNLPCSFLGVCFLRTHENNLKLEGPGTSGSGSQNRARALEVTVAGIIFSLALTESISSKAYNRDVSKPSKKYMISSIAIEDELPSMLYSLPPLRTHGRRAISPFPHSH